MRAGERGTGEEVGGGGGGKNEGKSGETAQLLEMTARYLHTITMTMGCSHI